MLQKSTTWKVAAVFYTAPTGEHYLKEISRQSGVAHTSVKRLLKQLEDEGIISRRVEQRGSRGYPLYKANFESHAFRDTKRLYNHENADFKDLINHLYDNLMPACIVLFGSYQRGEDIESSDIDLFIEGSPEGLTLEPFEKKLGRRIELHIRKSFKKLPPELKSNIANGTVVKGYLDAF